MGTKTRRRINGNGKYQPVYTMREPVVKRLCQLLEDGVPADTACDMISLPYARYQKWMSVGDKWVSAGEENGKASQCGSFALRVRKSQAAYKAWLVDQFNIALADRWRKPLAMLERRDRLNFSKREQPGSDQSYDADEKFL